MSAFFTLWGVLCIVTGIACFRMSPRVPFAVVGAVNLLLGIAFVCGYSGIVEWLGDLP